MKKRILVAVLVGHTLVAGVALAEHKHDGYASADGAEHSDGTMGMSPEMQQMRHTMHRLQKARTLDERQALMRQHGEQMRTMMEKMQRKHRDAGDKPHCSQHMHEMMKQMMAHVQAQTDALQDVTAIRRYGPPGKGR